MPSHLQHVKHLCFYGWQTSKFRTSCFLFLLCSYTVILHCALPTARLWKKSWTSHFFSFFAWHRCAVEYKIIVLRTEAGDIIAALKNYLGKLKKIKKQFLSQRYLHFSRTLPCHFRIPIEYENGCCPWCSLLLKRKLGIQLFTHVPFSQVRFFPHISHSPEQPCCSPTTRTHTGSNPPRYSMQVRSLSQL